MLIDEALQTSLNSNRKALHRRVLKEGLELWTKQQEFAKLKKLKEQKEMREMLENYWPFGKVNDMKPRGLRNLRLEGLFPNKDYLKNKRFVGTLDLGKPGGGAPLVTDTGKKLTRTREDPQLRFQHGTSNDLERCVNNTLRYKSNRQAQEEYKKELDKLVEEKRKNVEKQRREDREFEQNQFLKSSPWGMKGPGGLPWRLPHTIGLNFLHSMGWSSEKTIKQINDDNITNLNGDIQNKNDDEVVTLVSTFNPCKSIYKGAKTRKLTPLSNGKENGIELVPLIAKQRKYPIKTHLDTTDVTNNKKIHYSSIWNRQGSAYLRDLTQQMSVKEQNVKDMKVKDSKIIIRHFDTYDGFWGRPGNGAPRSIIKKQQLDRLLYPQMVPISVH